MNIEILFFKQMFCGPCVQAQPKVDALKANHTVTEYLYDSAAGPYESSNPATMVNKPFADYRVFFAPVLIILVDGVVHARFDDVNTSIDNGSVESELNIAAASTSTQAPVMPNNDIHANNTLGALILLPIAAAAYFIFR